ncbi:MAG: integrase core domain-containing protein [Pyrinomonadaceae bacterium]|nr:integrase core domain-containing protein [Pyrinomonadaceae bacterium]
MSVCSALNQLLRALLKPRLSLVMENLALRQQLVILRRKTSRPRLRNRDRLFWVVLSHLWRDWRPILVIVKPETVIKWHRQGFKCYWRWKSRAGRVGRPRIDLEIRDLIRRMSHENPTWGVPRIQAELHLLGYKVAESTVAKYRVRIHKPPSQTWKTFLRNHAHEIVAIDFFTVPTVTFNVLSGFFVLLHNRRQVVHFNATAHPTALWTAQQIIEAFPEVTIPRFLLRDRDSIYGEEFRSRVVRMGTEEVITTARSPWQNPYAERLIGSIRRECLNHLIVFNERQLRHILREYFAYYNEVRPHQSLERNAPVARAVDPPAKGKIFSLPQVGGLHHRYLRAA